MIKYKNRRVAGTLPQALPPNTLRRVLHASPNLKYKLC